MDRLSPRYLDGKDPLARVEEDLMKQRIVNVGKPVNLPPPGGKTSRERSKAKAAKQARKKQRKR